MQFNGSKEDHIMRDDIVGGSGFRAEEDLPVEHYSPEYFLYVLKSSAIWLAFGVFTGLVVGTVASVFAFGIDKVTALRASFPQIIFGLPLAGCLIIFFYHFMGRREDKGTNQVLESIREGRNLPITMAPTIFLATVLTHLFGGSAGREGACLQIGGSIASYLGRMLHFRKSDRRRVIMTGMSAAFSAVFGTPMAAAVMAMEISTVGTMYYSALVPCVAASMTARFVSAIFGLSGETFILTGVSLTGIRPLLGTFALAVLCAACAALFCLIMSRTEWVLEKFITNEYIRIVLAGVLIVVLTLVVGNQTYNGSGAGIIALCMEGEGVPVYAFLLKMVFTAITLGAGYKGGEIIPSLSVGAALGFVFGSLIGLNPALCAAIGMCGLFCSVTNCPMTALLLSFEMFGYEAMPFFLMTVALTYMFSGNYGLYHSQRIRFSKYAPGEINRNAHH